MLQQSIQQQQQQPEITVPNPRQQDGAEWQLDVSTTPISSPSADATTAQAPAPAVNSEIEILGKISEIMQVVKEWVEAQRKLITQVNTLESKINTLIATKQQTTQQPPTKKKCKGNVLVASKMPRRKVAETSSYLEEE